MVRFYIPLYYHFNVPTLSGIWILILDLLLQHHNFNDLEKIVAKHHVEGNNYCAQKEWRLAEKM